MKIVSAFKVSSPVIPSGESIGRVATRVSGTALALSATACRGDLVAAGTVAAGCLIAFSLLWRLGNRRIDPEVLAQRELAHLLRRALEDPFRSYLGQIDTWIDGLNAERFRSDHMATLVRLYSINDSAVGKLVHLARKRRDLTAALINAALDQWQFGLLKRLADDPDLRPAFTDDHKRVLRSRTVSDQGAAVQAILQALEIQQT